MEHPLRLFRQKTNRSLGELAAMLGVTKATVSRWETGERFPDRELWPVIREVTGISADELAAASPKQVANS